jgi:polyhydroxyalkanoate synthase
MDRTAVLKPEAVERNREAPAAAGELGAAFAASVERLKALHENAEAFFDPLGIVAPLAHAQLAWMLHPQELADLASRYAGDLLALRLHSAARLAGRRGADLVAPQPDDTRFLDPVWSSEPYWDLLKQWYLFVTRQIQNALFQTPGLSAKERRRAAFWWRKWLSAIAPTNFLFTNPVAVAKAIETRGESLRRGFEIFMEDFQAGTVRMTSPEDFRVGKNLATTAGAVVFRNRLLELIHYAPTASRVHRVQVAIVTPWINKYYLLDLTPKKSLVRYLLDRGFDVYITSWKNPGAELAQAGFDDYLSEGVGGPCASRARFPARTRCTRSGTASAGRCSRSTWPGSTAGTAGRTCRFRAGRCSRP